MEFSELIANRYSVRAYRPDPIEDEKLLQVLEAAVDARPEIARALATLVRTDPHEAVRNLSRAISER